MPFVSPLMLGANQPASAVVRFNGGSNSGVAASPIYNGVSTVETLLSNNAMVTAIGNSSAPYAYVEIDNALVGEDIRVTIKTPYTTHSNTNGTYDIRPVFVGDVQSLPSGSIISGHAGPLLISNSVIQTTGSTIVTTASGLRPGFVIRADESAANATGNWGNFVDIMFELIV